MIDYKIDMLLFHCFPGLFLRRFQNHRRTDFIKPDLAFAPEFVYMCANLKINKLIFNLFPGFAVLQQPFMPSVAEYSKRSVHLLTTFAKPAEI